MQGREEECKGISEKLRKQRKGGDERIAHSEGLQWEGWGDEKKGRKSGMGNARWR